MDKIPSPRSTKWLKIKPALKFLRKNIGENKKFRIEHTARPSPNNSKEEYFYKMEAGSYNNRTEKRVE